MKEAIEREVSEAAKDLGEPWRVGDPSPDGKARVYDRNGFYLFLVADGRDPRAVAERVVDCVNSCADTRNPVEKLVDSVDPDCHHHRVTAECKECSKQSAVHNHSTPGTVAPATAVVSVPERSELLTTALNVYWSDVSFRSNRERMGRVFDAITPLIEAQQREKDALEMLADVSRVEIDKHNPGLLEADFADLVLNERRAKYLPAPKVQTPEERILEVLKLRATGYRGAAGEAFLNYQKNLAAEIAAKLKEQP